MVYFTFIFFCSLADLIEWQDMRLNGGNLARGPSGAKQRLKYKIKWGHFDFYYLASDLPFKSTMDCHLYLVFNIFSVRTQLAVTTSDYNFHFLL